MTRVNFDDAFSFVGEPARDFVSLRSDRRKRLSGRRALLVAITCLSFIGVLHAVFLNLTGIGRIPVIENSANDGGARRQLAAAPNVNSALSAHTSRRGSPSPAFGGPGRQSTRPQAKSWPLPRKNNDSTPDIPGTDSGTDESSRSQEADLGASDATALLGRNGIVRRSSGFILRSEEDVTSKLLYLRSRAEEFNAAAERLAVTQRISELEEWMTQGDASIAELAHQMGQFPGICRGGILYHGMNMEDNNVYEQLRAQKDTIVRNRNTSWRPELERLRRLPGPGLYEAQANLKGRRGAAFEALNDLIAAVADTKKSYDALRSDVKIRKALRGFAPLQLSPSPEFNSTIRELGEFQKWVGQRPTFTAQ